MTPEALTALVDATWPAARTAEAGGFTLRLTPGAGSRVSAASASTPGQGDIAAAEAAMRDAGQTPLFMVRAGEGALDAALAGRGYTIKDPVTLYTLPVAALTAEPVPPVTCIDVWPPLAIMEEIWDAGGIWPERRSVMHRAKEPRTAIFGRAGDRPAGVLFAAVHAGTVMLHAIEVAERYRRKGVAARMIRRAAHWAAGNGATTLALLVTDANPAQPLYTGLGMTATAGYHYRIREAA